MNTKRTTRINPPGKRTRIATGTGAKSIYSDQDVAKILKLLKGSGSVELKVVVPMPTHRATIQMIGLDPVEAQPRQAYFFDTADFALNKAGLVVRARRIQGGRADTVVKLRPVVPAELDPELRKLAAFNVEVDMLPGGFVCSASLKGRASGQAVRDVVAGGLPLKDLFSSRQRSFYKEHAPDGIKLSDLQPLGPTFILKGTFDAAMGFDPKAPPRRIVAEVWLYPDGSRILELSTKCLPAQAFQVSAEARAYLAGRGVELGGTQQTKTKTALEFYAGQLKAGATA